MYLDINGLDVTHTFDSVSEFLTFAETRSTTIPLSNCYSRKTNLAYKKFAETASFPDALNLAYKGFPKAREHGEPIRNLALHLISPLIIKPKPRYDRVGDVIDIPRYNSGIPDEFLTRYEPDQGITVLGKSSRMFRIGVNFTYVRYTDPKEITQRGATITALIDLLEQHHKNVEVLGMTAVAPTYKYDSEQRILNLVTFKEAGQPLDIDFMYFCLAHPSMLRRFSFSVWESYPEGVRKEYSVPGSYGRVAAPVTTFDCDIYFPPVLDTRPFATPKSCLKWLLDILVKQGAIDAEAVPEVLADIH